jgi:hypothetical protein
MEPPVMAGILRQVRGSTLTCESERLPTETHFHVGAFDQAARLQPMRHIFPKERLPWLDLADA